VLYSTIVSDKTAFVSLRRPLASSQKTEKQVQSEIQAILRQITASVSFLPVLSGAATFNVLAYTDKNVEVPAEWVDSDAKLIAKVGLERGDLVWSRPCSYSCFLSYVLPFDSLLLFLVS
jgi:hypothetical protein